MPGVIVAARSFPEDLVTYYTGDLAFDSEGLRWFLALHAKHVRRKEVTSVRDHSIKIFPVYKI